MLMDFICVQSYNCYNFGGGCAKYPPMKMRVLLLLGSCWDIASIDLIRKPTYSEFHMLSVHVSFPFSPSVDGGS